MAGVPVEHDPFAANGVPVEHDPFAPKKRSWTDVPGEALGNIPASAKRMASGLYEAVTSPVQTVSGAMDVAAGGLQNALPKSVVNFVNQFETNPDAAGGMVKERYGSVDALKNTLATDPVGAAGDLSLLFSGGAGVAARTPMLTRAAPALRTAAEYTNPLNAITKPVASMISPNVAPEVKTLMNEGITPTPGQILGGGAKRFEEGLSSVPVVGDFIKNAQLRAVEDLNKVAFDRALKPIGKELPKDASKKELGDLIYQRYPW